jgi:sugar transferase (PEP-CTERM/EpsH1 system associated)
MIEHLGKRHEVHVVSMIRNDEEATQAPGLLNYCAGYIAPRIGMRAVMTGAFRSVLTEGSLSEAYFGSTDVHRAVRELLAQHNFDRIVLHCSAMGQYAEAIESIPRLIDFCDIDSEKWRIYADRQSGPKAWMYRYEQHAVARLERRLAESFELCSVATAVDLDSPNTIAKPRKARRFANGVDLEFFKPRAIPHDSNALCFVGRMDYFPNIECVVRFVNDASPIIRAENPEARFVIVGAEPTDAVRELANTPGVQVTGTVKDVRDWVGQATAMVAPLATARGTQNKILEAMSLGVPVITSPIAARGGHEAAVRRILVSHSAQEVAQACLALMNNAKHRRQLSIMGRRVVRQKYSWPMTLSDMEAPLGATLP